MTVDAILQSLAVPASDVVVGKVPSAAGSTNPTIAYARLRANLDRPKFFARARSNNRSLQISQEDMLALLNAGATKGRLHPEESSKAPALATGAGRDR